MSVLKKALAALLAALMCMGCVACSVTNDTGDQASDSSIRHPGADTPGDGGADGTESETEAPFELPDDLSYDNTEINIFCQVESPDLVGDVDGDVVSAAVFERNRTVENRLKIQLNMVELDGDYMGAIRTLIMADDDTLDIAAGYQYIAITHARDGLYRNMADNEYLDWEKPWWSDDYMNTIQIGDERYVMIGDISLTMLKAMSAFFVNKQLFEDEFGNINTLYSDVFAGKWTWDMMTNYVSRVYRDANGNNKTDAEDILGMRGYHESPTDHMGYTAGLALSTRAEDGTIVLIEDQSRNIEIAEAMYKLMYENRGCFLSVNPQTFESHFLTSFAEGKTLFCAFNLHAADYYRDMDEEYAIITHPKFDMQQEDYLTLIHDDATMFAVPTTVNDEEAEMLSAVLECMCYESYKRVTPVYYDVVLKSRYSKDPQSAQAIDMIRANVHTDFIYANNYVFSSAPLGTILRTLIGGGNNKYASTYKRYSRVVNKELQRMMNEAD